MGLKPCNLIKEEWDILNMVFDEYVENLDSSEETSEMLQEIYQKVFFMNYLIEQQEENE